MRKAVTIVWHQNAARFRAAYGAEAAKEFTLLQEIEVPWCEVKWRRRARGPMLAEARLVMKHGKPYKFRRTTPLRRGV